MTQLQSVPLSQAVNLCSHKLDLLYSSLCADRHQSQVIKHLVRVSLSVVFLCCGGKKLPYCWFSPSPPFSTQTDEVLTVCVQTFVFMCQVLSKDEYGCWLQRHLQAETAIQGREELLFESALRLETNLHLLGNLIIFITYQNILLFFDSTLTDMFILDLNCVL